MRHYNNLLYVAHGMADETAGLKQAISLARNNEAQLKVLVIAPEFPGEFSDYQKKYEESLIQQAKACIESTKDALNLEEVGSKTVVELLSGNAPAIRIIEQVLRSGHDLVIKEAEPQEAGVGFKALDMDLLRKCPVPVWLCQPISNSRGDIKVAVAIDPESQDSEAENLSKRMIELSSSLAGNCSGELHIISCWDYALESDLRNNIFIKMPADEVDQEVDRARLQHYTALKKLIEAANIECAHNVHHLRGKPETKIPAFVKDNAVDILVMGTVARTGIPGFIIGNTAENIVQKLGCSLMALKPQGFVSPVKAY